MKMANEIIYVCNSTNNKNVREGELEILRAFPEKLYFEFGESETNIKKRFYNDLETLNKDFNALLKLKEGDGNGPKSEEPEPKESREPRELAETEREEKDSPADVRTEANIKSPYRHKNKKFLI